MSKLVKSLYDLELEQVGAYFLYFLGIGTLLF